MSAFRITVQITNMLGESVEEPSELVYSVTGETDEEGCIEVYSLLDRLGKCAMIAAGFAHEHVLEVSDDEDPNEGEKE